MNFQPLTFIHVPTPRVNSDDASKKTLKRRSQDLSGIRTFASGSCSTEQFHSEIELLSREEREKLIKSTTNIVEIGSEHSLAMKADLSIPWNKLRTMRRL